MASVSWSVSGRPLGETLTAPPAGGAMILWLYVGPEEQIEDISLHLLSVKAKAGVRKRTEQTMQ